ncbi:MAG: hypothetical protein GMKNLPBB_00436 [Myxococcota bacterium]|nr:hypothetical protein [Myxococcota bacterium]
MDSADLRDALESTATTVSCTGDQRAFHWECYSTRPGDPLSKDELLGRLTENLGSRLARQAAEFLERRYNKRGTGRPNG